MPTALQKAWEDPRIESGMRQQLRWRRELMATGKKPLGWKLAFGGPAAMERLRINAPLVGFLMADAVVDSGSTISFAGWKKPAAEPELAVYIGKDLASGDSREATMDAIAGLGPAIELAAWIIPPTMSKAHWRETFISGMWFSGVVTRSVPAGLLRGSTPAYFGEGRRWQTLPTSKR